MIVISAFEPFGGKNQNASLRILECIQARGEKSNTKNIKFVVMPVKAGAPLNLLPPILSGYDIDYILGLGEAARIGMSFEQVARNSRHYRIPDNNGNKIDFEKITEAGAETYEATYPYSSIEHPANKAGIETWYSDDAGGFLCNEMLYTSLHLVAQSSRNIKTGFIHVPESASDSEIAAIAEVITVSLT